MINSHSHPKQDLRQQLLLTEDMHIKASAEAVSQYERQMDYYARREALQAARQAKVERERQEMLARQAMTARDRALARNGF
jgi:hypothetical protein